MKKESENFHNNNLIRSFGRIKSRKLSDRKEYLLKNLLPTYELKAPTLSDKGLNILEIGFGFGDYLFEKAKNNPQNQFFGFEPHINGAVNLLSKLEENPLQNLKISTNDVRPALENFPDNIFDEIYILFPDPWPKTKHIKRRLINVDFLDNILAPKMKAGGKLIIATDHDLYKIWILSELSSSKKITWRAKSKKDWQIFPNDWTVTKYQKKAEREGRVSVIFNSVKHGI